MAQGPRDISIGANPRNQASLAAMLRKAMELHQRGQLWAAQSLYQSILAIQPRNSDALNLLGVIAGQMNDPERALELIDRAIKCSPRNAVAHSNKGRVLRDLRRYEEALKCLNRAVELQPDFAVALSNRGAVLRALGRLDAALASYDRAIAVDPNHAEAHSNRGVLLEQLNRVEEALASHETATTLLPDFAMGHLNKAYTQLLVGNYELGWREHEWRWKAESSGLAPLLRPFRKPLWLGRDDLSGRTLLLWAEQGAGDVLQFCRYVPLAAKLGARVILEVPSPLHRLLDGIDGADAVIAWGESLPEFDFHCPLMSLPLAFGTTLKTIPAEVPYLRGPPNASLSWKDRLGEPKALRVGLVWSGGFRPHQPELWSVNHRRNIPLEKLAALANPGIEFFSLQKGQPAEGELSALLSQGWDGPRIIDYTALLNDYSDTAALIMNLDLVICVDTSVAHLAGALGKPVWILNRFDTCWRWLLGRSDSPWYPTARLYRQAQAGDWDGVVRKVADDLRRLTTKEDMPQAHSCG
jgi:Tfp pilus assembly protein PilF